MDENNPFRPWLDSDPYDGNWIPVARLGGISGRVEMPVLFPWGENAKILDHEDLDWPIRIDGARPSSWITNDGHNNWREESNLYPKHEREGLQIDPLVAYLRRPSGRSWLEPIQGFVLYHEAAPTHESGGTIRWYIPDEDGRPDEIACWQPRAHGNSVGVLSIRRDKLLDFIHDFHRSVAIYVEASTETDAVPDGWVDEVCEPLRRYRCIASDLGGNQVTALLRAVTIIERPPQRRIGFSFEEPKEEMEPFLTALDKTTGERIESRHPPASFMTPVFFKAEVLDRYYADPEHYRVDRVTLNAGGMWSLRIAHTGDGHIHAWLGDLGHLPRAVQQHWRRFAAAYDKGVPEWRLQRDFHGSFVEAPGTDAIDALHAAIANVNDAAQELANEDLIREPDELNRDRVRTLHVPFYNSIPAFQTAIETVALLVNGNISIAFLDAVNAPKADGALNRLAAWISDNRTTKLAEAKELLGGLYAVQALRSTIAAHRAGAEAEKVLERAQVDLEHLPAGFRRRIEVVVESLDALAQVFRDEARGA
jgi:hypothetical protein